VDAYDRADTHRIATGTLETLDNQIDVTTGTLKLKARFDNEDDALFPNQFVNARLHVTTRKNATAIPVAAVQQGSAGSYVFLVQDDNTVQVRQVKLGPINGGMVAVNEGLKPGDRVVTEGTDRLRAGAKVEVVTSSDVIPSSSDQNLGAGAPAGTTPATRPRSRHGAGERPQGGQGGAGPGGNAPASGNAPAAGNAPANTNAPASR